MEGEAGAILGLCAYGWRSSRQCGELKASSLDVEESGGYEEYKDMIECGRERSWGTAHKAWT